MKVDVAILEKREMQFLYKDNAGYVFMDSTTFDQMTIPEETVTEAARYLLENMEVIVAIHEEIRSTLSFLHLLRCGLLTPNLVFKAIVRQLDLSQRPSKRGLQFKCRSSLSRMR